MTESSASTLFVTPEIATDAAMAAKALSHHVRVQILGFIAANESASPSEISEFVGATGPSLGTISYHVRELVKLGAIELSRTTPRRGALEHHYRLSLQARHDLAMVVNVARSLIDAIGREN